MKPFKIRASAASEIAGSVIGLTETQLEKHKEYSLRKSGVGKPLTEKMDKELKDLDFKLHNPTVPQGLKTYCQKWLKQELYGRRENIENKYTKKGNLNEEDGVTLLSIHLGRFLDTNTEPRENAHFTGVCDIDDDVEEEIIDIKNSYSLDSFPMFEEKAKQEHIDQVNVYCDLYGRAKGSVVYVLTCMGMEQLKDEMKWLKTDDERQDYAYNRIFVKENWDNAKINLFPNAKEVTFVEIPAEKRIKIFKFNKDEEFITNLKKRVQISREYIKTIL